jgi:hypothetical protein
VRNSTGRKLSQKRSWQLSVGSRQLKTKAVKNRKLYTISGVFAFYCKLITAYCQLLFMAASRHHSSTKNLKNPYNKSLSLIYRQQVHGQNQYQPAHRFIHNYSAAEQFVQLEIQYANRCITGFYRYLYLNIFCT